MSYRYDQNDDSIVIDGWEKGISSSPYTGIANIRNLNTFYYPSVAYVNYKRQAVSFAESGTFWYAGIHSVDVSGNTGWIFTAQPAQPTMTNPVGKTVSPAGLIYILDDSGQVWKQSAVNSSTFNLLGNSGRYSNGASGIAYWENYLAVFGNGLIEWCGDGSGDAAIISGNWNLNKSATQPGSSVFTTNYSGGTQINGSPYPLTDYPIFQNGDPILFTTTGTLPAPLVAGTVYYLAVFPGGTFTAVSLHQTDTFSYVTVAPKTGDSSAILAANWNGPTGSYVIKFSDGEVRTVTLTNGSPSFSWSVNLVGGSTTSIQIYILLTSDGTGTHTITDIVRVTPYGNCTNLTVYPVGTLPYTQFTLDEQNGTYGSYVDPTGETVTGIWKGISGTYQIILTNGQKIDATFTNNSPDITIVGGIDYITSTSGLSIQAIDTTVSATRPYVSQVDGNLYFLNGRYIAGLLINTSGSGSNLNFSPAVPQTLDSPGGFDYGIISVQEGDTATDLIDLQNNLVVSGQKNLYLWDYVSTAVNAPSFVSEPIKKITNILNNIYILAGQKGNIYVFNGYSAQLMYKMPDYITGVFDPVWNWGDLMFHRSRLFFQALAQNTSGTNLLAGIFSLQISPALTGEQASGLNMEAQNSYGLIPVSGALSNGLLIDNEPSSNGQDSYYSAWSNGVATGGIDYNNTTLWSNFEPTIETDVINVGNVLSKKTFGNITFTLDRPLTPGDSISIYARASLSDSYTFVGTTTTTVLSANFPSTISQQMWLQLKITFSGGGTSFIPLREIRIQVQ